MIKKKFTEEELQQYIHHYKSDILDGINKDTAELYEKANQTDTIIGNQLMVLSSAFVTVIGGFIVIQSGNITNNIKYAIFFTLLSFLIALIAGLKNLHDAQGFWLRVAEHKHQEGPIVIEDESKDYKSLNKFRSKLQDYRDKAPKKSKVYARKIQTWAFVIGIVLFIIATMVLLFNFPQEESRTKPQHNSLKYYRHQ